MVKQVEHGERQGQGEISFARQANDLQVSTIRISSSGDLENTSEQWKEPWLFGVYNPCCVGIIS